MCEKHTVNDIISDRLKSKIRIRLRLNSPSSRACVSQPEIWICVGRPSKNADNISSTQEKNWQGSRRYNTVLYAAKFCSQKVSTFRSWDRDLNDLVCQTGKCIKEMGSVKEIRQQDYQSTISFSLSLSLSLSLNYDTTYSLN